MCMCVLNVDINMIEKSDILERPEMSRLSLHFYFQYVVTGTQCQSSAPLPSHPY